MVAIAARCPFCMDKGRLKSLFAFQTAFWGFSGCFGVFRLPETVARLAPSPSPQREGGLGRRWQFAKLRLPLPLSRKNFRSGNRPHPSPPPQAGEGMRWLICFRLPYASAVSRRKTPVSPLRPGRSPWPGGCRRAFWPAAWRRMRAVRRYWWRRRKTPRPARRQSG